MVSGYLTNGLKEVKLEEITLPEAAVLEKLNAVSTAKRLAKMVSNVRDMCISLTQDYGQELHDSEFGRREEIHKIKREKRRTDLEDSNTNVPGRRTVLS